MNLDRFWTFVNLVFQFNGGERTAIKMCKGEVRLGRWKEYYSKNRKEFQQCIDEVVLENPNFNKTLFVYATKFQELIKKYEKAEILKEVVDKDEDEKKYYLQQIHKTRYKEVKTACYHIKLYLIDYVKEIQDSLPSEEKEIIQEKENTMSNPISDFYNVIWTFDKGQKIIDSINKGEFTLEQYEEMLYNKRQAFDECLIDSVFKKVNIGFLYQIINRLDSVLCKDYSDFDFSKDDIETKCHYIRYKQLAFAVNHSKDLLGLDEIPSKDDGTDEELKQMYLSKTNVYYMNKSDEELKEIYDEIKDEYLSRDSSFEQFRYCMTGQGKPTARISWVGQKDTLAYFIETFFEDDGRKWKKSEGVFGMKVANSNLQNSKKANPFAYLKKKK